MSEFWHVADGQSKLGPLAPEDVLAMRARGDLSARALVWHTGLSTWEPIDLHFSPASPKTQPGTGAETVSAALAEAAVPRIGALLWCGTLAVSLACAIGAVVAYRALDTAADAIDPARVVRSFTFDVAVEGALAGVAALAWVPIILRFRRFPASNWRFGVAAVATALVAVVAFVGFQLRLAPVVRSVAEAGQRLGRPTVRQVGTAIEYSGPIAPGSYVQLRAALDANPSAATLVLDSGGGIVSEAMRMGRLVSERGLATHVDGRCFSACMLMLVSGGTRTADVGADLALHAVSSTTNIEPAFTNLLTKGAGRGAANYLETHGVPAEFIQEADRIGPTQLDHKTPILLTERHVLTGLTLRGAPIELADARWASLEAMLSKAHQAPIEALLRAIRVSDPDTARAFAPQLYDAVQRGDGGAIRTVVGMVVRKEVDRAAMAAQGPAFQQYIDANIAAAGYFLHRNAWIACSNYENGVGEVAGLPERIQSQELLAKAALVSDAAARNWEVPERIDSTVTTRVVRMAQYLALQAGVDITSNDGSPRSNCVAALALLNAVKSAGEPDGHLAFVDIKRRSDAPQASPPTTQGVPTDAAASTSLP